MRVIRKKYWERRIRGCMFLATLFGFVACSETEHTEAVTAEITAAQIEGRTAARDIINKDWKDTLQLQTALLETKARQSRYLIDGNPASAAAFDSAFISTIRIVDPSLARKIKKD